jgi:hypothetical protein
LAQRMLACWDDKRFNPVAECTPPRLRTEKGHEPR